ncbi:hypothetical protein AB0910_05025 [Streptomyces sp. NPDC047002]|uniref:hypothetical protein n=1 Tax=Streptomyces sp. NPDC047002 TaxID=3155475 RepID=UPI00345580BD
MAVSTPTTVQNPRHLLAPEQLAGVRTTVLDANPDMTEDIADRIVHQALAFVEPWRGPDQSTITIGALTWHTPKGPNRTPITIEKKARPKGAAPK